ncbi:MAG: hypothetical protein GXY52_05155 [Chloroflexi bacterium]|nr:hypothetical protein [Chloroflexota bacterium]
MEPVNIRPALHEGVNGNRHITHDTPRQTPPDNMRSRLWVFILFLSIFLVTFGGHFYSYDEEMTHRLVVSIADQRSLSIPINGEAWVATFTFGVDAKHYSPYGWMVAFIELPLYYLGSWLAVLVEPGLQGFLIRFVASLVGPISSALSCMVFYTIAFYLYASERRALVLTLLFGLCTLVWPYSKMNFSEPLLSLFLILSFYWLFIYQRDRSKIQLLLSGLMMGAAVATKIASAVFAPVFAVYLLMILRSNSQTVAERKRWLTDRLLPLATWGMMTSLPVLVVLGYNWFRFASLSETGYGTALFSPALTDTLMGLYGLLLSPGKSVFLYALPTILFLPALVSFRKRWPKEALIFVLVVAVNIAVFAPYKYWAGGVAWGPRFLVILMPYMVLPAGTLFDWFSSRKVIRTVSILMLCIWMAVVQIPGMLIHCATAYMLGFGYHDVQYVPRYSPLRFHLLRSVALARDWGSLLLGQAPPETEAYQGDLEDYYNWVVYTPHRPVVPPYWHGNRPGPIHYSAEWFLLVENYHWFDAWWWYWWWIGLPKGWILLVLIPLGMIPISLWRLRCSARRPDFTRRTVNMFRSALAVFALVWIVAASWLVFQTVTNMRTQRVELQLGQDIALRSYDIDYHAKRAGDALSLMLYWQINAPALPENKVLVELVDRDGHVIAQEETQPTIAATPTYDRDPQQTLRDAHYLTIPADTPPGNYRVLVGMYELESGTRLPIQARDGTPLGDVVELSMIRVK